MNYNIKQLQGSLRLIAITKRFVMNYRTTCRPLTKLLKKHVFNWDQEAITTFELLKEAMVNPLVLALTNLSKPFL
jgi:hypothetical protein